MQRIETILNKQKTPRENYLKERCVCVCKCAIAQYAVWWHGTNVYATLCYNGLSQSIAIHTRT